MAEEAELLRKVANGLYGSAHIAAAMREFGCLRIVPAGRARTVDLNSRRAPASGILSDDYIRLIPADKNYGRL